MGPEAFDIVGNLPREIAEKIFMYLNGRDLSSCFQVSQKWCHLSCGDILWKRICMLEYPEELKYIGKYCDPGISSYKHCYDRGLKSLSKWEKNEFWKLSNREALYTFYPGNGGILGTIMQDSRIILYDLNYGKPAKVLQTLDPFTTLKLDRKRLKCVSGKNITAFEVRCELTKARNVFTFIWNDDKLRQSESFHCVVDPVSGIKILPGLAAEPTASQITLQGMLKDSYVLYNPSKKMDYFYNGKEVTGQVYKPSGSRVYSYEEKYFLCSTESIVGYDLGGKEIIKLDISNVGYSHNDDIILHFNREILLAEVMCTGDIRTGIGWRWSNLDNRLPAKVESRHELVLHPKNCHVCYIEQPREQYEYQIIILDLQTDCIVSITPFILHYGTDESFFGGGHFSIVHYRFALFLPNFNIDFYKENILIDLKSGKTVFHESSKQFEIQYVGHKLLEAFHYEKGTRIYTFRIFT